MVTTFVLLSAASAMVSSLHASDKTSALVSELLLANTRMSSVTKMERDWRETAQMVQAGKTSIDQAILNNIKDTMDSIYTECEISHQGLEDLVTVRRNAVTTCASTRQTAWVGIDEIFSNMSVVANDFATCMANLCVAEDLAIAKCQERDDAAADAHANIPNCSADADSCGPSADTCESCTVLAKQWYDDYYPNLTDLVWDCMSEQSNVTNLDQECAAKHPLYEADWCQYEVNLTAKCDAYDQCYDDAVDAYTNDTDNMTSLTAANINVCYAVQKVKCWLDTISTCQGSTDNATCHAARADCDITDDARFLNPCIANLTVVESDPPFDAREPCNTTTLAHGVPGSGSWKNYWYESDNIFHNAICDDHHRFNPPVAGCSSYTFTGYSFHDSDDSQSD